MLMRLAYLGITNAFALRRLLPGSDRDKDAEILALRHQLAVLHRQLGDQRVRFEPSDRAWLAVLLQQLPRASLCRLRLLVRPDTICAGTATCLLAPRGGVAASAAGPATHRALDPRAGAAPGGGEPIVGVPAGARGIAHPGD
jgi:hypothetical protein